MPRHDRTQVGPEHDPEWPGGVPFGRQGHRAAHQLHPDCHHGVHDDIS
ncbi:MAG: hypothetical protein U0Q19_17700 [Kineosporiaceae bacterium]